MTLEELARKRPFSVPPTVPEWTLGCFHRRSITFANGMEDTATSVIWVQSHGLTGDIRIPKNRPPLNDRKSLADCSADELIALARGEGFGADTAFADGVMSWETFCAFQPYDKWPEPGRLERVGTSLIEWAPSGTYVEDWRLQPGCAGLAVGLKLISETRLDGVERPRSGALVISGDHALLCVGRRLPMPRGRVQELIRLAVEPKTFAGIAFDCQVAYAIRNGAAHRIVLSVDPFANGADLFVADGFELGEAENELIQRPAPSDPWSLRRWKIDTLLADQKRSRETPAAEAGLAWLKAENDTLLPPH